MRSAVGAFSQYEAQVASVNHQLEKMISLHKLTDGKGFANLQSAAQGSSKAFAQAAASTGQFEVRQLRLNSATDTYIKKLNAQKLSIKDLMKQRAVAHAAYKQQLAMENMSIQQQAGNIGGNKNMFTTLVPKEYSAQVDTARKRLGFLAAELKSGSTQMINWGKNTQWAGRQLMVGFTMPIAAFGAAAGVMAYQVDKELTRIAKVYDTVAESGVAKEKELLNVRKESLATATIAAKEYGYAAKETLQVTAALAATGKTGSDLQKSALEVQRISRLGEVDQETAINATIALQSIWKQSNEELTESFDYMNSVENSTSLQTADFAAAIPIAGAAVKSFGGDIQELGVLLTAMRENGIGAVQGANALKATMQRLGRPSKQIRMEWQELTGTDIGPLVENSKNLTEVFQNINKATKDLDPGKQRKAFAGLFGSYQVARMMAMTKGMEDLENGVGQVSTAFNVAQEDSSEWAKTAAGEIEQYQKSVAGQWDTALATMKQEIAGIGEPFVIVATTIVKGITSIVEAFQKLPAFVKIGFGIGVALTAIAGGVIMLTGLFGNLIGSAGKGIAFLMGLAGKADLMDTENRAMKLSADLASQALMSEADAATVLKNQVELLTASLKEADLAQRGLASGITRGGSTGAPLPPAGSAAAQYMLDQRMRKTDINDSRLANYNSALNQYARPDSKGRMRYRNTDPQIKDSRGRTKTWMNKEEAHASALHTLKQEALDMDRDMTASVAKGNKLTAEQVAQQKTKNQYIRTGVGLMGMQTIAMGLMVQPLSESGQQLGSMLMTAGMIAPVVAMAVSPAKKLAGGIAEAAVAGRAASKSALGLTGGLKGAGAAAKGIGVAMWASLGPIGLAAAAVAAIGSLVYIQYNKNKKAREEAIKDQKTLNGLAKNYADETGRAWEDVKNIRVGITGNKKADTIFDESSAYYSETDAGKASVGAYKGQGDSSKAHEELDLFVRSQVNMKMSAREAAENVRAFMIQAGEGFGTATARANELLTVLGEVQTMTAPAWEHVFESHKENLMDTAINIKERKTLRPDTLFDPDAAKVAAEQQAEGIINTFMESIRNGNPEEVKAAMDNFTQIVSVGWSNTWDKYIKGNDKAMEVLKKRGINSLDELKAVYDKMPATTQNMLGAELSDATGEDKNEILRSIRSAKVVEDTIISQYASYRGMKGEIEGIKDLTKDPMLITMLFDYEGQVEQGKKILEEVKAEQEKNAMALDIAKGVAKLTGDTRPVEALKQANAAIDEAGLARLNVLLRENGLRDDATTAAQALRYLMERTVPEAKELEEYTDKMGENLSRADFIAGRLSNSLSPKGVVRSLGGYDEAKEALQSAMKGVQEEIADAEKEALDRQLDAAKDRAQAYWDAEKEALDERHEREKKALEKAWDGKRERVEAYWDARIDGIDKIIEKEEEAEKKRKRIFEAELSRIQRLADMANTNIDFNVALNEGNLDEAARIQNNAQAEDAQFIFGREQERGSRKSEKKVDRLDKSKDRIEEQKDKALEAFDEREDRAKESFDKIQKMEKESLEKRSKNDMAFKEEGWKRERKMLDRTLQTFKEFVPKNKAELVAHMKDLGLSMRNFGNGTLKTTSKEWGDYVGKAMQKGLSDAALKHASDKSWERMGKGAVRKLIKSLGFTGREHYNNFMKTGKIKWTGAQAESRGHQTINHGGGLIDGGAGSGRAGVAKTYHGTHSSEVNVLARKGEYMVNENATKKHRNVLEAINQGTYNDGVMGGANDGHGHAALISGVIGQTYLKKFKDLMTKKVNRAKERQSFYDSSGGFARAYNLPGLKPWVSEAATYLGSKFGIDNIGGVADRTNNPFSDHPRGLALDFMTNDVDRGNALTREALKLGSKLDATYMIWQKKIHSFDARGWRDYRHPSGQSNPTLDHMDHVHMSFSPNGKAGDLPTRFGGKLIQGPGGKYHPTGGVGRTSRIIHGNPPAYDVALPTGNKIYAVRDGVVSSSYDLRGTEPGRAHKGNGYRSYGRVVTVNHDGGGSSLYAHLSQRIAQAGQRVNAGTVIGRSGDTGNSSGPHLHFGATPGPGAFLRKGAEFVKYDNTPATLHRGESVLTKNLTKKMHEGVDRFANSGSEGYNVTVEINGYNKDPEELAREVIKVINKEKARAPQSRSVGGKP